MPKATSTYRSPFDESDSDSSSAAVPRVKPPVTRSSTAALSKPGAESKTPVIPAQTTSMKRKRADKEDDIMGANWKEMGAPSKTGSMSKKPRVREPEKAADDELAKNDTVTQPTPQKTLDLEANFADMKEHHQKEMNERNKEIISLTMRLNHDLVTKVPKPGLQIANEELRAECAATKKAHEEETARVAESREKEIADLKAEHASDVKRREDALEEKFREGIRKSKAEEQSKAEREAARAQMDSDTYEKTKAGRRIELLEVVLKRTTCIKMLYNRQRDGTISQAKDSEVLSMQECVDGLTTLWAQQGAFITRILPHELSNDRDFALEFEADTIVMAQAWMQSLELRSAPQELLQTGWSLSALHRLMCGLFPYHDTDMMTLYAAVVDVHRILQEATAAMQGGSAPAMLPMPSQNAVAMNMSVVSPLPAQDQPFFPPQQQYQLAPALQPTSSQQQNVPAITVTQPNPIMPATNARYQQSFNQGAGFLKPEVHTGSQHMSADMDDVEPTFAKQTTAQYTPQSNPFHSSIVAPPARPGRSSYQLKACRSMRDTGECFRGERCKFSHDPAIIAAARAEANGGEPMQDVDTRQPTTATAAEWQAAIPCRWVTQYGSCRTASCGYMHAAGTHRPGNPTASSAEQCHNEKRHGSCKNATCNRLHQRPHGPLALSGGGLSMADDTISNASFQIQGASNQQCKQERDRGYCNRIQCKYTHQKAHGPQKNGATQPISPFTRSLASRIAFDSDSRSRGAPTGPRAQGGLAARITYDHDNQFATRAPRGQGSLESRMTFPSGPGNGRNRSFDSSQFAPSAPTGPRTQASLESRMTFPESRGNSRPAQQLYNAISNPATNPTTPGGRGGRGGRGVRGRGNFGGRNVFQSGQGQTNDSNAFQGAQGGHTDSNPFQGGGRGMNMSLGGRGGFGGGGRGGADSGFRGGRPLGGGRGIRGTRFGVA